MLTSWIRSLLRRPSSRLDVAWITPDWGVGAAPSPDLLSMLTQAGFSSVLDLRAEARLDPATYEVHGLRLKHLLVEDGAAPTQAQLDEGAAWVLGEIAAGRRVLLCCLAGSGRSVTMACAVLVAMGYPLGRTLPLVAGRRSVANPTEPQVAALRTFAARHAVAREEPGQS